ncbi:hypothetical protein SBA4_3430005 [Candidatus Sulfopaludibacter sp. SbA4]|nr:hypothetical protein SBA4_3430005 [Candidatus Sulfopaludibacter sp. SbA4]
MTPPLPPDWKCPLRVGFLFPHACLRTTPVGCPDCQSGQIADPYAVCGRYGYSRYDYYGDDYFFDYGPEYGIDMGTPGAPMDFTEADGADMVQTGDQFENDMTES